ncbi:MAG: hypothetical protein ACRDQ7_04800 [Haloechinothrix sp.]
MARFARLRRFAGKHIPVATRAEVRELRRRAREYKAAYTELAYKVRATTAQERFFERLSSGESLPAAATATARALVTGGQVSAATSFADALAARQETATVGHLAAGVVATHRKLPELASAEFRYVPDDLWLAHAVGEYLDAAYRCDPARAVTVLSALVADQPDELGPQDWYEAVRYAVVAGELEVARQAYRLLVARAEQRPDAWPAAATEIAWLRPWMDRQPAATAPPVPDGHVPFALIDYRQPGRAKTSQNIGDHIQTLASLGHLVRHQNVRVDGEADLAEFVTDMRKRVRPERRLDTPPTDVTLYTADRDASTYDAFPEGTWVLAFGWYMHPLFGVRHDFPPHPNLRPIFVSFHCNKREMLTQAAIDYLRRYGPVGCRDWTTVDLLLSIGVPAYFSGCLTTTVDTLFPDLDHVQRPAQAATIYAGVAVGAVPADAPTVRHSYPAVKRRSFVRNLRDAVRLLESYRQSYTNVVTSRLHCYLPVRSLGLDVDFRPKNRTDVRFNGLIDIDDAAFEAIRTGMLARLEPVMSAILAGKPEAEIYRLWADLCAEDVAAAEQRHTSAGPLPVPALDVAHTAQRVRAGTVTTGPSMSGRVTDLLIPVGPDDVSRLTRTLASVLAGTSRPLRLWLLASGCGPDHHRKVADDFPGVSVNWLPCDDVDKEARLLLLPDLLTDRDRVTVLPSAAVLLGDIADLAERDLGGHPLAARSSLGIAAESGFTVFYRAAKRLHPNAALAHEWYRRVHARHVFDFDAFDTEVLVLDLVRMRTDHASTEMLPYIERFGLTATEALTLYAGPNRAVLPPEWAHVPTHERVTEPLLVHWPGTAKPWKRRYARGRQYWDPNTRHDATVET